MIVDGIGVMDKSKKEYNYLFGPLSDALRIHTIEKN